MYVPVPKKVAMTIAGLSLPVVLWSLRNWPFKIMAVLVAILTWVPLVLLWLYDKKPYGL
jgi:hypothetical protein